MSNAHPLRASLRLKGYDYSYPGYYFITICTHERERRFGHIEHGTLYNNAAGEIACRVWQALALHYLNIRLDAFIAMPDHVHGLLQIHYQGFKDKDFVRLSDGPLHHQPITLTHIVNHYKSLCAREINALEASAGRKLWQRSYHERIVREVTALHQVRSYILTNPERWSGKKRLASQDL